jgi:amidase
VPGTAGPLPTGGEDTITLLAQALGMVGNTAPLDASGHPAISVPAGLIDGLPVGMMIMGKRFDDATVLRVADAFERISGGFATPDRGSRHAGSPASHPEQRPNPATSTRSR